MKDHVGMGFALGLGLHALVIPVLFATQLWVLVVAVSLAQFLWLGPLFVHLRRKGLSAASKGVLILAGVTFLVNATCFGLVMTSGFH